MAGQGCPRPSFVGDIMRQYRGMTKNGKWVYGWYRYHLYYEIHLISYFEERKELADKVPTGIWREWEVIPETVGQQIGRKDKSNVEIYERDVIRGIWQVDHKTIVTGIVKYYPDYGLYALENDELNTEVRLIVSVIWDTCEVLEAPNDRKP